MLAKINRIKGLGLVFSDFAWSGTAPSFRQVNLIYGWNGCGKTTFTRLFDRIASGDAGEVDFELEDATGAHIRPGQALGLSIRVFNQDYVSNNVRILESQANSISILLGEENKELADQIRADEQRLNGDSADPEKPGLIFEARSLEERLRRAEKTLDSAFTDVAKTIGAATMGSGATSRTYRAPDAKRDFEGLTAAALLPEAALKAAALALRQEALPEVPAPETAMSSIAGENTDVLSLARDLQAQARQLCARTVEADVLVRLVEHPDISDWVEQGIKLHGEHAGRVCEYCGGIISEGRVAELARHFSDADRQLKREIDQVLADLRLVYAQIDRTTLPDGARLYSELRASYSQTVDAFGQQKTDLLERITALGKMLQRKKAASTEPMTLSASYDVKPISATLGAAQSSICAHNAKTATFDREQKEALASIRRHYLSTIQESVVAGRKEVQTLKAQLDVCRTTIAELEQRVSLARSEISSAHRACEQINACLKSFLGRDELSFAPQIAEPKIGQPQGEITGYRILRRGEPALRLSEGEKTAIGFVYFVVHLSDGQFQPANGLVVIDDPISSLDSSSLYQAFSFLKNAVRDCRQVFVLTHSFEFLKLLLNWRHRQHNRTSHYMITNHMVGSDRRAALVEMDKVLRNYETEYQYLFKRLKEIRAEQDGTIAKAYPVPNMARKLWESFLAFRVPNGQPVYNKMDVLKGEGVDEQKLDAIYKFTNDQSHITGSGFDPALVAESQRVIDAIFEVMATAAPSHYRILDASTA